MQIKKKILEPLLKTLQGTEGLLDFRTSRIRDKFVLELIEITNRFLKDKSKIINLFCKRDENDKPIMIDNKFQFKEEDIEEINKELVTLYEEKENIEFPEEITEIIKKSNYKPLIGETEMIDEIINELKNEKGEGEIAETNS